MYEFINDLSESRLIPSKANFKRYTAQELSDLAVLNLCALYILWSNNETRDFAEKYARRTLAHGYKFDRWQTNSTDLYVLVHGLMVTDYTVADGSKGDSFRENLPVGLDLLVRWLREMMNGNVTTTVHRSLFVKLDFNFRIGNQSIRAIRRLVLDWNKLTRHEHELAMTRLLQFMRSRAHRGELLAHLQKMAKKHDLELGGVCDLESGVGCDDNHQNHVAPKKKGNTMATIAGLAIGAGISSALHKK